MITAEKKFYQAIGQSLSCFTNNEERFIEIKKNLSNPYINKDNITYDPIKYMNDKNLMKKISLNRSISSNIFASQRLSHTNVSAYSGKFNNNNNALFGRIRGWHI